MYTCYRSIRLWNDPGCVVKKACYNSFAKHFIMAAIAVPRQKIEKQDKYLNKIPLLYLSSSSPMVSRPNFQPYSGSHMSKFLACTPATPWLLQEAMVRTPPPSGPCLITSGGWWRRSRPASCKYNSDNKVKSQMTLRNCWLVLHQQFASV